MGGKTDIQWENLPDGKFLLRKQKFDKLSAMKKITVCVVRIDDNVNIVP